jgi:cell division protein FtsN
MVGPGIAKVKITVIVAPPILPVAPPPVVATAAAPAPAPVPAPPAPVAVEQFAVQVGAFTGRDNAERIRSEMERLYGSATVVMREGRPVVWRVLVGREPTPEAAEALAVRIRGDGEVKPRAAFVVRLDNDAQGNSL